jgi:hypothetical protein
MSLDISITYDGREALTLDQIAELAGTLKDAEVARAVMSRLGLKPVAHLGAIYDGAEVRAGLAARPGRTGRPRREKPMYTITDNNTGTSATVTHDQIAETICGWYDAGVPAGIGDVAEQLERALTPGSSTAHDADALATFLDLTVQPA